MTTITSVYTGSDHVDLSVNNNIACLALNRPDKSNAFDAEIISALINGLTAINDSDHVRAVVLSGKGKHFSAGADLNWMRSMAEASYETNLQDARQLAHLMDLLFNCPFPTIAQVQGSAFGGALGLISCCDLAVGTMNSRFCLSEVKLGLVPAVISPYVNRCIGPRAMRRFTLTAEIIDAKSALELGILTHLTTPDQTENLINQLCTQLLANSPAALTAAKSMLAYIQNHPVNDQTREYTSELIADLRVSEEGQQGLTAFLDKSTPPWILTDTNSRSHGSDCQ